MTETKKYISRFFTKNEGTILFRPIPKGTKSATLITIIPADKDVSKLVNYKSKKDTL